MVSDDIEALNKIKKAKELLDMGAITEDEFNQIKDKYFKPINDSKNEPSLEGEYYNQSQSAFLENILENALGVEVNQNPSEKNVQQKAVEKATSQAANAVACEVTKKHHDGNIQSRFR